jgi:hypothetical protein
MPRTNSLDAVERYLTSDKDMALTLALRPNAQDDRRLSLAKAVAGRAVRMFGIEQSREAIAYFIEAALVDALLRSDESDNDPLRLAKATARMVISSHDKDHAAPAVDRVQALVAAIPSHAAGQSINYPAQDDPDRVFKDAGISAALLPVARAINALKCNRHTQTLKEITGLVAKWFESNNIRWPGDGAARQRIARCFEKLEAAAEKSV